MTAPRQGTARAVTPLWLAIYGLLLALMTFIQAPNRIVADTKLDLVVDPGGFLAKSLQMWDGSAAFGQIQNQAYGYLFPMGPFFLLGDLAHLDAWVIQRLWWTLLLCVAFYGVLRVARTLDLGNPLTQVFAAFAYTLSVHATTIIGASSVELWPSALAPWLLWCVVRGTTGGSERRWAAAAGLVVAAAGGVNAAAVLAILPLSLCWLVTRRGGRVAVFFGWWTLSTVLATLWWLVPLVLLGAYSFPFLDYIESASATTLPTSLVDVLGGTSNWVTLVDPATYAAGHDLATSPVLFFDALVLVGLGLAGLARPDNPHRRFLFLGLLLGVLAVSFGYTGTGAGWFHDTRQAWLDGALAPLRNLHKFDNLVRLPLALGMAHALAALAPSRVAWRTQVARAMPIAVAVLALLATVTPWSHDEVAPAGAMAGIPDYWRQAAAYLDRTDRQSTTLVVPASAFGQYLWGSPRDDVLQPLLDTPWAARNSIPLAQPGSVVLLDRVTELLESSMPGPQLAHLLAANGIGRLVVRNDLNPTLTGAPDPATLHYVLNHSPGLTPAAGFGPLIGSPPTLTLPTGERVAVAGGVSGAYPAVQVYDVTDPTSRAFTVPRADVAMTTGAPGSVQATGQVLPTVLGDDTADASDLGVALSDGLRRREEDFAAVRGMSSATMTAHQEYLLKRPVHERVMVPDQGRWESTVEWTGIRDVTASSSRAWVDSLPPLDRGSAPGAALDGSLDTAWRSAVGPPAEGQWWQVDLLPGTVVDQVALRLPAGSGVTRLELSDGSRRTSVAAPEGGGWVRVDTGWGPVDSLRVTATAQDPSSPAGFGLAEVRIPGVRAHRSLRLPDPPPGHAVTTISLTRDPGVGPCVRVRGSVVCRDDQARLGDDGLSLERVFRLPVAGDFGVSLSGSWRSSRAVNRALLPQLPFALRASPPTTRDPRGGPLALVDGDAATTWATNATTPRISVRWHRPHQLSLVSLALSPAAPAVPARRVVIRGGGEVRRVALDVNGLGVFPTLRTRSVVISVVAHDAGFTDVGGVRTALPVGVGSFDLRGPRGQSWVDLVGHQLASECGEGPTLRVASDLVQTRYLTHLGPRHGLGHVRLLPCTATVQLPSGLISVSAPPNDIIAVDHVGLTAQQSTPPPPTQLATPTWGDRHRSIVVPAAAAPRLLVVSQNANDGWRATLAGHTLTPQVVDGWRQGWWLPAGAHGVVHLTFVPQPWYVAGLALGTIGVLLVVASALLRRRPAARATSSVARALPAWTGLVVLTLAGGLLAGWCGALVAIVAVAARSLPWVRPHAWVLAAACAVVAGAVTARSLPDQLETTWLVQLLLVAALGFAAPVERREPRVRPRPVGARPSRSGRSAARS